MTDEIQSFKKNETKKLFGFVFLFVGLIAIDQLSKYFVQSPFLNYHFAFSIELPKVFIYFIYLSVLSGVLVYLARNFLRESFVRKISWTLILAGALSNVGERLVFGFVKDFIYINFFHTTGIYNIADFYILLGILVLLVSE